MSKNPLISLIILLFLLSISLVYADSTQGADLQSCSCSLISNPITIQNKGSIVDTFYITQQGTAAKWSTLFPSTLILESGESATIENLINPPCDVDGDYSLVTQVASSTTTQAITQNLDIRRCTNMGVVFKNLTQYGCNCTPFEFEFWVTNTGNYNEIYSMKLLDGVGSAVTNTVNPLILAPGKTQNIKLYINLPCDVYGELSTKFRLTAQSSGFYADAPLKLNVDACPPLQQTNVSDNVTAPPTSTKGIKTLLIFFVILLALLLFIALIYFAVSAAETTYYKGVEMIKEPKIIKPKENEFEVDRFLKSSVFKAIIAFVVLLIIALLIYKGAKMVEVAPFVNETNMTTNQTINVTTNITQPEINQTINVSGIEKLNLTKYITYLYYMALGFAILFLLILIKIRIDNKPTKGTKKNKSKKELKIIQEIKKRWLIVVALIAVVVLAILAFYYKSNLYPYLIALKEYISMYLLYILIGFVILTVLLFTLSKMRK